MTSEPSALLPPLLRHSSILWFSSPGALSPVRQHRPLLCFWPPIRPWASLGYSPWFLTKISVSVLCSESFPFPCYIEREAKTEWQRLKRAALCPTPIHYDICLTISSETMKPDYHNLNSPLPETINQNKPSPHHVPSFWIYHSDIDDKKQLEIKFLNLQDVLLGTRVPHTFLCHTNSAQRRQNSHHVTWLQNQLLP